MRTQVQQTPLALAATTLLRLPARVGLAVASLRAERRQAERMAVTATDRLARVRTFYTSYEELIETLLGATNFGPSDAYQRQYAHAADAMREAYAEIKPYLIAYLRMTESDAAYGLSHFGRGTDSFEILFSHERLADFVASDDGDMIARIQRTREALTLYTEHLRSLLDTRPDVR